MAYEDMAVQNVLPVSEDRRLGASASYSVESLILPDPGSALESSADHGVWAAVSSAQSLLTALVDGDAPENEAQPSVTELFWFRWIIGHQLCFLAWRLASEVQSAIESGRMERDVGEPLLVACVDGYTGLLIYSGSCPQDVYHDTIRPSLHQQHPAFSGTWSPDYQQVLRLFRGLEERAMESPLVSAAIKRHFRVHKFVAARLVPDGISLLQAAGNDVRGLEQHDLFLLYDNYFMTVRAPVTAPELLAQLLCRVHDVLLDVRQNGCLVDAGELGKLGDQASAQAFLPEAREVGEALETTMMRMADASISVFTNYVLPQS